jgi:hypothetical protein
MVFPAASDVFQSRVLFFIPALSVLSPVALPLGYYRNGDYSGLLFSTAAASPWVVTTYRSLTNAYLDKDSHLDARERGGRNFGLYWLFCGNASLVVDMYAYQTLHSVSYFSQGEYLGKTSSAIILSVLTPGGGMFYRGERLYGHLYYQADNFLIYKTLCAFSSSNEYDPGTGRYVTKSPDRRKAYMWLSGLIAVKAVEIVHTIFTRDRIQIDSNYSSLEFVPLFEYDRTMRVGAGLACRF